MPGRRIAKFLILLSLGFGIAQTTAADAISDRQLDWAPAFSPDGRYIAFYSVRGHASPRSDIYVRDLITGEERQITDTPDIMELEPLWSSDGQRLFFTAGPHMRALRLYEHDLRNNTTSAIYEGDGIGPPRLSPTQTQFVMWRELDSEAREANLLLVDSATGHGVELETGLGGYSADAAWSPTGEALVFTHRPAEPDAHADLYRLDLVTRHVVRLTQTDEHENKPVWSPDGAWIYFESHSQDPAIHIYRIASEGGSAERVTRETDNPAYFPALSSDGRLLGFSRISGPGRVAIEMRALTSPDGED